MIYKRMLKVLRTQKKYLVLLLALASLMVCCQTEIISSDPHMYYSILKSSKSQENDALYNTHYVTDIYKDFGKVKFINDTIGKGEFILIFKDGRLLYCTEEFQAMYNTTCPTCVVERLDGLNK